MGYIDYCITYHNGEEWSETKPFFDNWDMQRLIHPGHCEALAEQYGAKHVFVVGVRLPDTYVDYTIEGVS